MTPRSVRIAADAEAQLTTIRSWWSVNRPAATDLFDRELDAEITALEGAAHAFPVFSAEGDEEIRRVLLPRCRYALYFSIEPDRAHRRGVAHLARPASTLALASGQVPASHSA